MAETPAPHPTCLDATTACPRPAGPDPARDARIDVYRDRERRRAARALDRYIDLVVRGDGEDLVAARVAGERLVEACGDYVLARLSDRPAEFCGSRVDHKRHTWSDYGVPKDCDGVSDLQQKSHYGIPPQPCYGGEHGNDDESVSGVHGG